MLESMRSLVTEVIGTSVDVDAPLMQAGLNSLGSLRLGTSLKDALSSHVPATLVFDHPTMQAVLHHLNARHTSQIPLQIKSAVNSGTTAQ